MNFRNIIITIVIFFYLIISGMTYGLLVNNCTNKYCITRGHGSDIMIAIFWPVTLPAYLSFRLVKN